MGRCLGAVVVAAVIAAAGAAQAEAQPTSLQRYLSSMSWPMRASVLRVRTLSRAIDNWIGIGDPPFLGEIGEYCKNFLAVEPRGHVLAIVAPSSLQASHARLVRAYSAVRHGCTRARLTVQAVRKANTGELNRVTAAAHSSFRRFQQTALRAFERDVITWRSAVLRELRGAGLLEPTWLGRLG